jgi:hypothetical protein
MELPLGEGAQRLSSEQATAMNRGVRRQPIRKEEVRIGGRYVALVSSLLGVVRITGVHPQGGWDAVSERTGRAIRIRSARRLRRPVD